MRRVTDLFEEPGVFDEPRVTLDEQSDAGLVRTELFEGDDPRVLGAVRAAPCNQSSGKLFGDLRVPLTGPARSRHRPTQVRVVDLADRFDALHETRELVKPQPLVIHGW